VFFQLRYGKQPLELEKGKSTLKAVGTGNAAWDDLVEQLDQIKTRAVAGGLDDAMQCARTSRMRRTRRQAKDHSNASIGFKLMEDLSFARRESHASTLSVPVGSMLTINPSVRLDLLPIRRNSERSLDKCRWFADHPFLRCKF
jgi:hypothetical protein